MSVNSFFSFWLTGCLAVNGVLLWDSLEVPAGLQEAHVVSEGAVELETFSGALNPQRTSRQCCTEPGSFFRLLSGFCILVFYSNSHRIWTFNSPHCLLSCCMSLQYSVMLKKKKKNLNWHRLLFYLKTLGGSVSPSPTNSKVLTSSPLPSHTTALYEPASFCVTWQQIFDISLNILCQDKEKESAHFDLSFLEKTLLHWDIEELPITLFTWVFSYSLEFINVTSYPLSWKESCHFQYLWNGEWADPRWRIIVSLWDFHAVLKPPQRCLLFHVGRLWAGIKSVSKGFWSL